MDEEFFKNIPSEHIIDILSRLPIGSIIICKCVSKSWLDLLGSDEFVKVHLSRSVPCLAINPTKETDYLGIYELKDDLDLEHHEFHAAIMKSDLPYDSFLAGSTNGLIFLFKQSCEGDYSLFICNPLTCEYVKIKFPVLFFDYEKVFYGFGATKRTGQHKVVTIYPNGIFTKFECHVYTLETGLWRTIAPGDPLNYVSLKSGVFMNGNLHWLVFDSDWSSQSISCFDLETELFSTFSCPPPLEDDLFCGQLSAVDHCLCICGDTREDGTVIWLMKEYGVDKSWTKKIFMSGLFDKRCLVCPIKVFRNGDILMVVDFFTLFCYSAKTKTAREIGMGAIFHTPTFLSLKSLGMDNVMFYPFMNEVL